MNGLELWRVIDCSSGESHMGYDTSLDLARHRVHTCYVNGTVDSSVHHMVEGADIVFIVAAVEGRE
eukprot:10736242-Ditylum_brightwellii.AAC.1